MLAAGLGAPLSAQAGGGQAARADSAPDPISALVGRLDLERYKATIKGLTQFGDRRQGTERNRAAVDWIEAQLKSYGCTNTERITYDYQPPPRARRAPAGRVAGARPARGHATAAQGGGRLRGDRTPTGVNTDSLRAARRALRALNAQPTTPGERAGGVLHEGRHHASRGDVHRRRAHGRPRLGRGRERRRLGHGARDGARARLQRPDVQTDRSIRFVLWNNEETGLNGATRLRRAAAGAAGEGRARRVGQVSGAQVARHDPARHDDVRPRHAAPGRHDEQGAAPRGRREHRVPDRRRRWPPSAQKLAWAFATANEKYATDYPAAVGQHMTNTDSAPFQDLDPGDQPARERARARRSAPAGIRSGTSRPTSSRPTATRISASGSTPRRRRSPRSRS